MSCDFTGVPSHAVRRVTIVQHPTGIEARYGIPGGKYALAYGPTVLKALIALHKFVDGEGQRVVETFMDDYQEAQIFNEGGIIPILPGDKYPPDLYPRFPDPDFSNLFPSTTKHLTKESLPALYENFLEKILETLQAKNHDYTGSEDPFANFRASEVYGVDARKGILLRAQDKFMRINTHIEKGKLMVEGEGVEDAIADVIGYMLLLYGLESERKGNGDG